jgi:hypothetical protein
MAGNISDGRNPNYYRWSNKDPRYAGTNSSRGEVRVVTDWGSALICSQFGTTAIRSCARRPICYRLVLILTTFFRTTVFAIGYAFAQILVKCQKCAARLQSNFALAKFSTELSTDFVDTPNQCSSSIS